MNNNYWHDIELLDDIEAQESAEKNSRATGKVRRRKWREIETIKDQRRLRRNMADFEPYAYSL
ncbi:DUF3545 family protein [Colwellia piezophila]|uniref:DUF3545 family protein n=1 Tax=Colwellia piezophila TaxID=211668 RepID=UPI000380B4F7|nr:DUF3545 family protein [Colwellia piezophila]